MYSPSYPRSESKVSVGRIDQGINIRLLDYIAHFDLNPHGNLLS